MHIFVKSLSGKVITLKEVEPHWTIRRIKDIIVQQEKISDARLHLIYGGNLLADGDILSDYDIQRESTIHLALRTIGPCCRPHSHAHIEEKVESKVEEPNRAAALERDLSSQRCIKSIWEEAARNHKQEAIRERELHQITIQQALDKEIELLAEKKRTQELEVRIDDYLVVIEHYRVIEEILNSELDRKVTLNSELDRKVTRVKQLEESLQGMEDLNQILETIVGVENMCCVCMVNPSNVEYNVCKHICVCDFCSTKLGEAKCPICRTEGTRSIVDVHWERKVRNPDERHIFMRRECIIEQQRTYCEHCNYLDVQCEKSFCLNPKRTGSRYCHDCLEWELELTFAHICRVPCCRNPKEIGKKGYCESHYRPFDPNRAKNPLVRWFHSHHPGASKSEICKTIQLYRHGTEGKRIFRGHVKDALLNIYFRLVIAGLTPQDIKSFKELREFLSYEYRRGYGIFKKLYPHLS